MAVRHDLYLVWTRADCISYEMRREAQEIIPGLFLGAFNTATNADRLAEAGITHLWVILFSYRHVA